MFGLPQASLRLHLDCGPSELVLPRPWTIRTCPSSTVDHPNLSFLDRGPSELVLPRPWTIRTCPSSTVDHPNLSFLDRGPSELVLPRPWTIRTCPSSTVDHPNLSFLDRGPSELATTRPWTIRRYDTTMDQFPDLGLIIPKKRTRTSKQKVKTGCLTCKIRHVKCDEHRPVCLRCVHLGKECGGYSHLDRPVSAASPASLKSSPKFASLSTPDRLLPNFLIRSPKERRAIEFFYHKAVPQLSGYFQGRFWSHCLDELSHDAPATRHAIFALSCMYEEDLFGSAPSPAADGDSKDFAIASYNKSIRSLITQLNHPEQVRSGLTVCILFICIACLRRDVPVALKHIDGGIKLLAVWRENYSDLSSDFEFVEGTLLPLLAWLNMVASIFGRPTFDLPALSAKSDQGDPLLKPQATIADANCSLIDLSDKVLKFMASIEDLKHSPNIPAEILAEQLRLHREFDTWLFRFREVTKTLPPMNSANLMLANHLTIKIFLSACLSPFETVWDQYRAQFEEILALIEQVTDDAHRFPDQKSKEFTFELGILPSLQFVVGKCRYPLLRRRALKLIRSAPKRECIFDSTYCYALYERVMHIEEASLGLLPGQIPRDDQLPAETARICHVDCKTS
ncbi:hypothetical protein E6O75_ATG10688 [Venturia nashicola]|uniref:Zn(2)-C6 fungal-type domain-containing protein n=1 Tax=Venturia nashicola TaxID=86259 RepID=A0A4Z1P7M7_9PEZI|nr:hypothetical protein E6O75_ATG10688 [Venturia nashicola]